MNIAVVVLFSTLFIVANLLAFSAHQQEHHPDVPAKRPPVPAGAIYTPEEPAEETVARPPETVVQPMVPKPRPLPEAPQQRPAA